VVDAVGHGDVGALGRRRDEHALAARLEVELGLLALGEQASALQHQVDPVVGVLQVGGALHRRDLDLLAVHHDPGGSGLHLGVEDAVHRVVLEQVRQRPGVGEVVDGDELQVLLASLQRGANHAATDASETVDCDPRHVRRPPGDLGTGWMGRRRRTSRPPSEGPAR
jgi:hypothetical protein